MYSQFPFECQTQPCLPAFSSSCQEPEAPNTCPCGAGAGTWPRSSGRQHLYRPCWEEPVEAPEVLQGTLWVAATHGCPPIYGGGGTATGISAVASNYMGVFESKWLRKNTKFWHYFIIKMLHASKKIYEDEYIYPWEEIGECPLLLSSK